MTCPEKEGSPVSFAQRHPGLEYEPSPENSSAFEGQDDPSSSEEQDYCQDDTTPNSIRLVCVFVVMVLSGATNAVLFKLQTIPMYNYPNFVNLYGNFVYIPLMFGLWGASNKLQGSQQQVALPKRPFLVMGCLDCLSCTMQVFASVYLPGPLLILLPQAAIPVSMFLSNKILQESYTKKQYMGAVVVLVGIFIVMEPIVTKRHLADEICQAINVEQDCTICQVETNQDDCLSHFHEMEPSLMDFANYLTTRFRQDDNNNSSIQDEPLCEWTTSEKATSLLQEELILVWSFCSILACIPNALSSIYKEIALSQHDLDPIYLNGWVAVFQFCASCIIAVPAGMATSPPVEPLQLPLSLWNGFRCLLGRGSIDSGCHPDEFCASGHAFLLVNLCLGVNVVYTLAYTLLLKYGSANLLFLASTAIIPIGNFAFALPVMPQATVFHVEDMLGLGVILLGLVLYRFGHGASGGEEQDVVVNEMSSHVDRLRDPLLPSELQETNQGETNQGET